MVTTNKRRQVVTHLMAAFQMSARRACKLVRLSRSRWHYELKRADGDAVLRERLKVLATERPRFGYKRLHLLLRREGVVVNHKRVLRLYREERLAVRPHRGRKHAAVARVLPLSPPTRRNERWGMDFIHDSCENGRQFRSLTMVDELTRECPAIEVDTSLPAARVIGVLDELAAERGLPEVIVVDNGPEFISRALDVWAYRHGIELHFIRPGKPVENAYIESFHSRFRDECLNANWFRDVSDARFQIELWRRDYNNARPHTSLGGRTPVEYADKIKQEEQQATLTERLSA